MIVVVRLTKCIVELRQLVLGFKFIVSQVVFHPRQEVSLLDVVKTLC